MLFSTIFGLIFAVTELPASELIVYRTQEKGRVGYLTADIRRDSGKIFINYTSDRILDVTIDQQDLRTLYVRKIIAGVKDYEFERTGDSIWALYRGKEKVYHIAQPVYDRHTLDYVFRRPYDSLYRKEILLSLPELGVKKVVLHVMGTEMVKTELGEIPCWRVVMTAKVLFLKFELVFLMEKEYPYRYVRFGDKKRRMTIFKYGVR